jgi:hypothetical protein
MIQQPHSSVLLEGFENLCSHKNLHMVVYSSFIHNCQNLEAIKIPSPPEGFFIIEFCQ